jgi:hypothetical protein
MEAEKNRPRKILAKGGEIFLAAQKRKKKLKKIGPL